MKVIIKKGDSFKECEYPNRDITKVVIGLSEDLVIFTIEEVKPTGFDPKTGNLKEKEVVFTDRRSTEYPHLLIAVKEWYIAVKSNASILAELDNSVGAYLDLNYPIHKRIRHSDELMKGDLEEGRKDFIDSMKAWELRVLSARDDKENELLTSGTFPNLYDWEELPNI